MNRFDVYDPVAGKRRRVNVTHNES